MRKHMGSRGRMLQLVGALKDAGVDPLLGAEIGVQFAKTAVRMLTAYPKLNLFLVDSYDSKNTLHHTMTAEQVRRTAEEAVLPFFDRVVWMILPSVVAASVFTDGKLDYVYIDAEHTYEAVREDIEAWLPKMRTGGAMIGHDYSEHGVRKAVDERFGRRNVRRLGRTWWVKKEQ